MPRLDEATSVKKGAVDPTSTLIRASALGAGGGGGGGSDRSALWVVTLNNGIHRVDTADGTILETISGVHFQNDIDFDSEGNIWSVNDSTTVSKCDPTDGSVISSFVTMGETPRGIAVHPTTGHIWVTNDSSLDSVSPYLPEGGDELEERQYPGGDGIRGLSFNADGNLWCSMSASDVIVLQDVEARTAITSFSVPGAWTIMGVAVDGEGNLWVSDYGGTIRNLGSEPDGSVVSSFAWGATQNYGLAFGPA